MFIFIKTIYTEIVVRNNFLLGFVHQIIMVILMGYSTLEMQRVVMIIPALLILASTTGINQACSYQFAANSGSNSSRLLHQLFKDYEAAISPHADLGKCAKCK